MSFPKTYGELADYEDYPDIKTLDNYIRSLLNVCKLLYQSLPHSLTLKMKKSLPKEMTFSSIGIKQSRLHNTKIFRGMDFTLLPTSVVTDIGVGYPFILSPSDYTIDDLNEFNRNMEEANFATRKQRRTLDTSNNTYYWEYFWHIKPDTIKPLDGFYKSSTITDSWNRICVEYGIVDGDTYYNFLSS
jgi:hypothetical protein